MESWQHGSKEWQQGLRTLLSFYEVASYSKDEMTMQDLENLRAIKKHLKKNWKK